MKYLEDVINKINEAELNTKKEAKFVYDFCFSLIVNQNDRDFLNLSDSQAKQIIHWLDDFVLPIYMEYEEFEKCKKVKDTINRIKYLKKIS